MFNLHKNVKCVTWRLQSIHEWVVPVGRGSWGWHEPVHVPVGMEWKFAARVRPETGWTVEITLYKRKPYFSENLTENYTNL